MLLGQVFRFHERILCQSGPFTCGKALVLDFCIWWWQWQRRANQRTVTHDITTLYNLWPGFGAIGIASKNSTLLYNEEMWRLTKMVQKYCARQTICRLVTLTALFVLVSKALFSCSKWLKQPCFSSFCLFWVKSSYLLKSGIWIFAV